MFVINPPITAIASGCCIWAPGPSPRANGTSPKIVVRPVIKIGRNLVRPARSSASFSGTPWPVSWPMYSIRMIPFFTSKPIKRIAPMNEETFNGVPVIHRANSALANDIGWAKKISIGSVRLRNWKPSSKNTSAEATIITTNRLANDSCCAR